MEETPGGFATHISGPGDTMDSIAARFGFSLKALIDCNPHISGPHMLPSDTLVNLPAALRRPITGFLRTEPGFRIEKVASGRTDVRPRESGRR